MMDDTDLAAELDALVSAAAGDDTLAPLPVGAAIDRWEGVRRRLSALLRAEQPDAAWLVQFRAAAAELRALAARQADLALYLLIHATGHEVQHYSVQHAMACAVIAEQAAALHGWPAAEADALVHAALSMNLAMTGLQDTLAAQLHRPTPEQRAAIDAHAAQGVRLLQGAGVDDPLWLHTVAGHHGAALDAAAAPGTPARRLAELLQRIDIYTAKLSRRGHRSATSPALAARDACLGADGRPDALGATLLRVLGLYPPGTWVQLANGDIGLVIARGAKAHTPVVSALRRADGGLMVQPVRRDTAQRGHAVVRGLGLREARVRVHHLRVLSA